MTSLGLNEAAHLLLSQIPDFNIEIEADGTVLDVKIWKKVHSNLYEAKIGTFNTTLELKPLLDLMAAKWPGEETIYVGEFKAMGMETPESMLAKIWNECLGPNPIPFDPVAREALIAKGRVHTELRRHIEAWQEMKRTGSKWATGEWMKEK